MMAKVTGARGVGSSRLVVVGLWTLTTTCLAIYTLALISVEGPLWVSLLGALVVTLCGVSAAFTWPVHPRADPR